ncbi:cell division/cell wall cluster transcriptional repressor MraZ [Candidatus Dojkabacteria bacterium]|nr:cell division/cell wall cluster transcriptional repressor MraZ [Candidatus Dojkabacteria bacterium]
MLIGEFMQKVGEKKRIAIPYDLRKELKGKLYITRGYENSLVLVNKDRFEKITSEITNGSIINNFVRDTARILVGGAKEILPDTQGRFVIPDNLFKYAQIQKEVVFVGLLNWIEVWSTESWQKRLSYLDTHGEEIAQKLTNQNRNE